MVLLLKLASKLLLPEMGYDVIAKGKIGYNEVVTACGSQCYFYAKFCTFKKVSPMDHNSIAIRNE